MEKPFRIISFFGGIDNLLRFFKEDDKIFYPAALSRRVRADQISLSIPLFAVDGFREETIMAPIRILGGRAGALRPWLFSAISQSRSAGRPVVLFVPEQYTLQAERDLLTGMRLPGLLSLDVVSPTKLKTLVREAAGSSGRRALDEDGRAMALHQALQARSADLTFYRNLGEMYGAVSRMEQTLSELREEGFTPDSLRELAQGSRSGARRAKFHDLSLILETYDRLLQDRFDDPAAAWTDLCARLGASGIWAGVDLYVYGFDTLRPDLRQLMLAAVNCCAEISVLLTMAEEMEPAGRIFRVSRGVRYGGELRRFTEISPGGQRAGKRGERRIPCAADIQRTGKRNCRRSEPRISICDIRAFIPKSTKYRRMIMPGKLVGG